MTTRAEKRRNERAVKKKLTDEQYEDFKKGVIDDTVQSVLLKFANSIEETLFNTLREHRVGEERANSIISTFGDKIKDE